MANKIKAKKNVKNRPLKKAQSPLFILLFIVICIALIIGITSFKIKTSSEVVLTSTPTPTPTRKLTPLDVPPLPTLTPTTLTNSYLIELKNILDPYGFSARDHTDTWWVSDDNWSIVIKNSESLQLVKPYSDDELSENNSETNTILSKIESYLEAQGFTKNTQNSSSSIKDKTFYDYIQGYQKGDDRCIVTVNPDEMAIMEDNGQLTGLPNITVSCFNGTQFNQRYQTQLPFLQALNKQNVVVDIEKQNELAAKVNVGGRRGGAYALFSKQNGTWVKIYEGQYSPKCSVLEEYSFPKEIYEACE